MVGSLRGPDRPGPPAPGGIALYVSGLGGAQAFLGHFALLGADESGWTTEVTG